ncbi:methylenetetrahydrofolate reductase [NAD(P)H] [bacterium]|nr:methylenetetrahydrofolate reductase [NAD(P)H] [bacterium]
MRFKDIYRQGRPAISFEVFPPRDDAAREALTRALPSLVALAPDFFTVTHGALGSERGRTIETVDYIRRTFGVDAACHLTCVGASRAELADAIEAIAAEGIHNIVALRGDAPKGEAADGFKPAADGFSNANQLVEHIRLIQGERGLEPFGIAVAGYPEKHPEAPTIQIDIANLKRKVDAGADAVITQLFYDNADFFRFVAAARDAGITVPIVPGLMPITSTRQIRVITERCGSRIPEELGRKMDEVGDDAGRAMEVGIEHTIAQATELLARGVPGIHFYVMNRSVHMERIMGGLSLKRSR